MIRIGFFQETQPGESRVSVTPDAAKKLIKKGFAVRMQTNAGVRSAFIDQHYKDAGVEIELGIPQSDVIFCVNRPTLEQIEDMAAGTTILGFLNPFGDTEFFSVCAKKKLNTLAMELIPRISRAQSMDALSSEANVAGYRAVLEAASRYRKFFPLMMTSAGSSKPAKVLVLGAGVAGLQAIATAKRLGAIVHAYDVRPEVREQIESLGAKCIDLGLQADGSGAGGYAKELSEEAKQKQQEVLSTYIQQSDVVVTTASIPGKKAPLLIPRKTVENMKPGSVIIDMAAGTGGNCEITVSQRVIEHHGVQIVGFTNYPSLLASDASHFYAHNVIALFQLLIKVQDQMSVLHFNLEDEIVNKSLLTYHGQVRLDTKR
jgi:NAD(P) transhydrogenase subunit alpha